MAGAVSLRGCDRSSPRGIDQVLMKMERARTTITNIFGRVPLTYTRFSLTPQTDGDNSQVEMKLADEEECGDQPMGDPHVTHQSGKNGCKSLCFKVLVVVLLFMIGFLTGYLSYRGRVGSLPPSKEVQCQSSTDDSDGVDHDAQPEMPTILDWSSLKLLLQNQIETTKFELNIKDLSEISPGTSADKEERVTKMVHEKFSSIASLKVWDDVHYVTLQDFNRDNKVTLLKDVLAEETFTPTSYVAYSPATSVTANLMYANYGTEKDFEDLREKNNLTGKIILVRSGIIPMSEKVRNAERVSASGVLIYPVPSDFSFPDQAAADIDCPFGHAHFGSGDPFTPGFPSFNHTQFPPSKSSGLPQIPVQTLSSRDGKKLFDKLDSNDCPISWFGGCKLDNRYTVKLEVNNKNAEKKIYNVFGVIKGFDEPDRYVVVGAQRDYMGLGVSKTIVGTSLLLELARMLSEMVNDGYKPRRSIVFASWSAGDFGAVGATEWLEGYLTTLHLKAIAYINLDAIIQGSGSLQVSTSPLLHYTIQKILKEVPDPLIKASSADFSYGFSMEDAAYPFLAYSGIPSVSLRFQKGKLPYAYLGTEKDTIQNLKSMVNVEAMCRTAANIVGQIILRVTHDHMLPLDIPKYAEELLKKTMALNRQRNAITSMDLNLKWMNSAWGDFNRASKTLKKTFLESDLDNKPFLRSLNDRIMKVEHSMLSPYVSPKESPFRHILYGNGNHTFNAALKHIDLLNNNKAQFNEDMFKNQLALLTWTVQSAANALEGEIWEIDNEF
ncbi:hypothetical protein GDO81_007736 [Engystomops pustulosus]|uniref:Transferrin receptor protein 1 n=2 Tax=Engystomops pustulosus TaxID=76066 RepID=A0AAV7C9N7_ENGPU|nr:hypothetical protein GDO81_007736 [Engystomops pustulosus]